MKKEAGDTSQMNLKEWAIYGVGITVGAFLSYISKEFGWIIILIGLGFVIIPINWF